MRTGHLEATMSMDEALERIAGTQWIERADHALNVLGDEHKDFTAEDIRAYAGNPAGGGNSIGAWVNSQAKRGRIRCIGYRAAFRPEAHGRMLRVWVVNR